MYGSESASKECSNINFFPLYAKLDFPLYDGKEDPRRWVEYNTTYHTTLHITPFLMVYRRDPPTSSLLQ